MIAIATTIPDLLIIEPEEFGADRDFFSESFKRHKFAVHLDRAEFLYKTNDYWAFEEERGIAWNKLAIGIRRPIEGEVLPAKDQQAKSLAESGCFA